jgi:hypothetical protein
MRRSRGLVVVAIAVALLVTQSACGPTSIDPTTTGPSKVVTLPTTTKPSTQSFATVWTYPQYCPQAYQVPIGMQPESAKEATLLTSLAVCTTAPTTGYPHGKGFYIRNYDDAAVWIIDEPALHWSNPAMAPLNLQVYRENVAQWGVAGLTLEPGQTLTNSDSDPMTLHMSLDGAAQGAWQLLALGLETVAAKGVDAAPRLLGGTSPTRTAMVTCMSDAYKAGSSIAKERANSNSDYMSRLSLAVDLGGNVTSCGKAFSKARATPGAAVTAEEILARSRTSTLWTKGNNLFEILEHAEPVLKLVLRGV